MATNAERNPIEALAEEFAERYRRGERPSLTEYTRKYPDLAAEIQEVFPALVVLEQLKPAGEASADTFPSDGRRPERIGDYRILREIGRGGMGIVYEAEQVSLGRHVALKVLPTFGVSDSNYLERFRREAKAAARLHHTNIVPVFGVGESNGVLYYAMQFIHGEGLDRVLRDVRRMRSEPDSALEKDSPPSSGRTGSVAHSLISGRFTMVAPPNGEVAEQPGHEQPDTGPSDSSVSLAKSRSEWDYCRSVARVGLQVAEALSYAHKQGILHRDIKPSNLLLDVQGTVWITDFGLAKSEGGEDLTQSGDIVGTIRYMAPERFEGDSLVQGDVYGLGVTLYEMLALRPAFDDSNKARLIDRISRHDPPPRSLKSYVPRDLETIVLKCIARTPRERYATADNLSEDLRRFLSDRPIAARRSPPIERLLRWCRRNPGWAAVAGLVLLVAAGTSALSIKLSAALSRAGKAEAGLSRKVYESRIAEARAKTLSRRPGQKFESLALLEEASRQAQDMNLPPESLLDLRNATLSALIMPDLWPVQVWPGFPPGSVGADFDDRLEIYARADRSGNCSIRRVRDDSELYAIPNSGPVLSRDGQFLVTVGTDHRATVWRLDKSEPRLLLSLTDVYWTDFHVARPEVAFSHTDGSVTRYDLASVQKISSLSPDAVLREVVIALHPRQPLVAVASYFSKVVQVRDLNTGAVIKSLDLPQGCSHVAWHPRGDFLLACDGNGPSIHVFDAVGFQEQFKLGPIGGGGSLFFNHAGDRLATYDWGSTVRLFDFARGQLQLVMPPTAAIGHLRFSVDDCRMAGFVRDGQLGVWQLGHGREYRALTHRAVPEDLGCRTITVSPDGRLLAAAMKSGIGFWDLETGSEAGHLPLVAPFFAEFGDAGELIVGEQTGCYRWPVQADRTTAGLIRIGPPEPISLPPGAKFARSADGRLLATAARAVGPEQPFAGAWILDRADHNRLRPLALGKDTGCVAVSPDGNWLAATEFQTTAVTVWEARTGQVKQQLVESGGGGGGRGGSHCFSPDGRYFAVGGGDGGLFSTASWERNAVIGDIACFAPDSRMAVVTTSTHVLRLVDFITGQELARLEDPEGNVPGFARFTPDGARLLVLNGRQAAYVWDLRLLRQQLAERGLDWDAPQYPQPASQGEPLRLQIDLGNLDRLRPRLAMENYNRVVEAAPKSAVAWYFRGRYRSELGLHEQAIADLRRALELRPTNPLLANDLARLLATAPLPLRDAQEAVELAERAVANQPGEWSYVTTLGIALYRAERYQDGIRELDKSMSNRKGECNALNLYYLAMAHCRLGQFTEARDSFSQAIAQHEKQKDLEPEDVTELNAARGKAATLLSRVIPR
jgi:serine/threonine protein kinase/WD40 repeat protein/Flp pilus assembly protein TadD